MQNITITMKNIIFGIMLLIGLAGCAQFVSIPESEQKTERVFAVQGKSKLQLFQSTNQWFATTFHSSNNVIQLSDGDAGVIVGRAITDVDMGMGMTAPCYYTVRIEIKDEKIRFTANNYQWVDYGNSITVQSQFDSMQENMAALSIRLESQLKTASLSSDW